MTDRTGTSLKRFALRVATLAAEDRDWLYRQLPAGQRARLESLVSEVIALQLHRDPTVLEALAQIESETPAATGRENAYDHLPVFWRELLGTLDPDADLESSPPLGPRPEARAPALRRCLIEWADKYRPTTAGRGA